MIASSKSFSPNSPSLPQNPVSCLFRNSTLGVQPLFVSSREGGVFVQSCCPDHPKLLHNISKFLLERSSQQWMPKPQFWCLQLRFKVWIFGAPNLGSAEGVTPICSDFPVFFRCALLVFGNTPICSDLLRFLSICSDLFSEQIRETPFGRPLLQIPKISAPHT